MRQFGIGEVTAPTILAELSDAGRLRRSRQAVPFAGLDVGVHRSDRRSRPGKLTRQGAPYLRWALYEAAQSAGRTTSPDHRDTCRPARAAVTPARRAHDRAQACPALLPHAARARRRGARPDRLTRSLPIPTLAQAQLSQM